MGQDDDSFVSTRDTAQRPRRLGPSIGVVLLDMTHVTGDFGRFSPSDTVGLGRLPKGVFECPATWPFNTVFAVAKGADPVATLHGEPSAIDGLVRAVDVLESEVDLITTNCGFFWAARDHVRSRSSVPVLLSGLGLLGVALRTTSGPVGVLTHSAVDARRLLVSEPAFDRVRIVGYNDLPSWRSLEAADYVTRGGWTLETLANEFLQRTSEELQSGGALADVRALVLECTGMPRLRPLLRELTRVPIFDVLTQTEALLR